MLSASASTGCLVLDEVTFPGDDPEPTIVSEDPTSDIRIGSVIAMAPSADSVTLNVLIHDKNIRESLAVRLVQVTPNSRTFVDGFGCNDNGTELETLPIGAETRSYSVTFSRPLVEEDCYQLMLVVANSYAVRCSVLNNLLPVGFDTEVTRTDPPNQAGVATWWIVTTPNADAAPDMTPCVPLFTELLEADGP